MAKRLKGIPNLPFAPIVAVLFGIVSAILVFATPSRLLERVVGASGLSSALAAARPPLGDTARTLMAVVVGLLVGLVLWLVLRVIEKRVHESRVGAKKRTVVAVKADGAVVAAASAARKSGRSPIFAGQELGAPLMSDEALASGEELFLDPTMLVQDGSTAPAAESEVEVPLELEAPDVESESVAAAEPLVAVATIPSEPVRAAAHEPVAEPQPEPVFAAAEPREVEDERSLVELVNRFESALERRKVRLAAGEPVAPSPIAGTVANLRDMIGGVRKSAA
jgi:hypothetical protein